MTTPKLADNITIADIIAHIGEPIKYLCGVLENMNECRLAHGSALVRIGTTGRGIAPHYRVEPDPEAWLEPEIEFSDYFQAYHGKSQKLLDWGMHELKNESWSKARMKFEEVQTLLGGLRGFEKRRK